jgi:hypothetical protein
MEESFLAPGTAIKETDSLADRRYKLMADATVAIDFPVS